MKILCVSDLHLEFHRDGGLGILRAFTPNIADVLVIAGDLTTQAILELAIKDLCNKFRNVIYVTGNHEYYFSSPQALHQSLQRLRSQIPNLHWLHNESCTIDGVRFGGTTLWFAYDPLNSLYESSLSDFGVIQGFKSWVYQANREARSFLEKSISKLDIVITHHLPSPKSLQGDMINSQMNRFYLTDMEATIANSNLLLWVHGHIHTSIDYKIGKTRVICNALGYPQQPNCGFNSRLIIQF